MPQGTSLEVPVLVYHNVAKFGTDVGPYSLTVDHLRAHVDALFDEGWQSGFVRDIPAHGPFDGATIYLTFDDAYESYGDLAVPALAERGAKSTVFVPTAYLGRRASWPENGGCSEFRVMNTHAVEDLDPAAVEIGSHGHHHLQLDLLAPGQLRQELRTSRAVLEDELGRTVTSLSYPFGYHNGRVRTETRSAGYTRACEMGLGLHRARPGSELRIRRLHMTPSIGPAQLLEMLHSGQRTRIQRTLFWMGRPAWRELRRVRARRSSSRSVA